MTKSLRKACADAGTNYLICNAAVAAGYNDYDVASSLAYLDMLVAKTVKALDACNTIEDCKAFANSPSGRNHSWVKGLGYADHAAKILSAMTAAMNRAKGA